MQHHKPNCKGNFEAASSRISEPSALYRPICNLLDQKYTYASPQSRPRSLPIDRKGSVCQRWLNFLMHITLPCTVWIFRPARPCYRILEHLRHSNLSSELLSSPSFFDSSSRVNSLEIIACTKSWWFLLVVQAYKAVPAGIRSMCLRLKNYLLSPSTVNLLACLTVTYCITPQGTGRWCTLVLCSQNINEC